MLTNRFDIILQNAFQVNIIYEIVTSLTENILASIVRN